MEASNFFVSIHPFCICLLQHFHYNYSTISLSIGIHATKKLHELPIDFKRNMGYYVNKELLNISK